ncbi:MAG: hypothetical protein LAT54_02700 [Cryomorphaceae bacterium]|nr:hypothetical protein [Cryomorphaceae bacterium]
MFYIIGVSILISSCKTTELKGVYATLERSVCQQLPDYQYDKSDLPQPFNVKQVSPVLADIFSEESLRIMRAIQVEEVVEAYVLSLQDSLKDQESRLEQLMQMEAIQWKLQQASLEVSATAAEIDCEEERSEQIAGYLLNRQSSRETRLTVAAISIGAVGALSAVAFLSAGNELAAEWIGITTALSEVVLAGFIFFQKTNVLFYHPRNHLAEIWKGEKTSSLFPPSVWFYLNGGSSISRDGLTLREELVHRWKRFNRFDVEADEEKIDLYFGEGGKYAAEQLSNRSNLLDQVESFVALMKQDLSVLMSELNALRESFDLK